MKAILEFNLPEDNEIYKIANNAGKLHSAAYSFAEFLRSKIKYDTLTPKERQLYIFINTEFHDEFEGLL